jgi:hypothetical protein
MWKNMFIFLDRQRMILVLGDGLIHLLSMTAALMMYHQVSGQDFFGPTRHLIFLYCSFISFSLLSFYAVEVYGSASPQLHVILTELLLASIGILLILTGLTHLLNFLQPVKVPLIHVIFLSVALSSAWRWLASAIPLVEKKRHGVHR